MKKSLIILVFGLISTAAGAAVETGNFYDSIGLDYLYNDVDSTTVDGFGLNLSKSFTNNIFVQGGYSRISSGSAIQGLNAELGYAYGLTQSTDLVATAGLAYEKLTGAGRWNASETGFSGSVGFRSHVTDTIDLGAAVLYSRFDSTSDTAYSISGRWHFSSTLSAGIGYTYVDSDVYSVSLGVAYHF